MLWMLQPPGLLFEILKILLMLRSWPSPEAFQYALDATFWRQSPLECYANFLLEVRTISWCQALGLITLGFSDTILLLRSQLSPGPVRQALDATLLAVYWNFQHALGDFNSLNYLAGCPTLSLCLVLGRASTLLTLRSWLFLKHGALFLLLFVTH